MRLEVVDLSAGRRERPLIRGLSFSLGPGERVALTGPSGIGKTTVLRAIALLDDPIAGSLMLAGRSPVEHGIPRWRRRVVLLAQRASFFGGSVADELRRPFGYRSAERSFDEVASRRLLERAGLGATWDRPALELSEGERQRVALVRALALGPSVLLLDEPTSSLDPESTERAEALLADQECSLVLVSHLADQRERMRARSIDLAGLRVPE